MPNSKKSIVDIFQNNELKISVLYKIYSQKIIKHKSFWSKLSDEEITHSKQIAEINNSSLKESFKETKFTRGIIAYIDEFIDEQIKIARKKKLSHLEALSISLRIEQSLLEKKCFEIFIPTNQKMKEVMEKLNKDTQRHEKLLRKELEKQKIK